MSRTEAYALDRVGETNEDESFDSGPLSMLTECVRNRIQVLVSCRNNRKLLGYLKAFDRHFNLLMEEVTELWTERPKKKKKKKKNNKTKQQQPQNKDRFLKKLFIRGDSVIIILKNPK
ncbi:small nuclear ribonucleoprotein sm d2 [Anaeramoeba flamelloides]|uniref:Small nuclear ribonucleoprotein Sm D2 n=1 Tax=Anaeramoeba flamelloides TaxID=1746091 RepID=A0AAV7ZSA1_9EUKA|nr:small nuclear ribonucleoprotein sm d2 [Anaeramoeba flamelloides]KAJ6226602.1 small nuclear ribonucleoprotein sm d2 [Anaeramoeba flamelloides]KAJ6252545.1 small nuclear ribonucleoprotein sm d2 [Anaeramoeba flamelloides]